MSTDDTMVQIPRATLHAITERLRGAAEGTIPTSLGVEVEAPELRALTEALDATLAHSAEREADFHERTMELAMGVSECFQVLADVRKGDLNSRVSEDTLTSSEEFVAKLGASLNGAVEELQEQMETIERQQFAIAELSTPVLQLWEDVLAIPIIGLVDTARSSDIMERMLQEVVRRRSQFVILDITGVDVVDTRTADYFIKMVKAAQLLGARCLLTGIQPAVAQTLVDIGVDLSTITTLRELKDGLQACLRLKGAAASARERIELSLVDDGL